jgi:hypothetical protein
LARRLLDIRTDEASRPEGGIAMAQKKDNAPVGNKLKDPDEWTTGEEPMTGAQDSYLHTLAQEAGEPVEDELTKAEASKKIDELQEKTGRGVKAAARTPRAKARKQA